MWPFSEMSLPAASLVGTIANWTLLVSLIGGVLSTFVIVKTSDVKEEHWAEDRRLSNERIAVLATQGDEAKAALGIAQADIAKANAQIAEANARALEAQAALEKFKAPRVLAAEQQQNIIAIIRPWAGVPVSFSVTGEPEPIALMQAIRRTVTSAGWVPVAPQLGDLAIDGAGVATTSGIEIQVHPLSSRGTQIAGAANALAEALSAVNIAAIPTVNAELKNETALNVMVGKKP